MRQLMLPVFGSYALREITVRKVDQFIKTLATTKSYSMAKQARTVLSLAFRAGGAIRRPGEESRAGHRATPQATLGGDGSHRGSGRRDPGRRARLAERSGFSGPPPDGQLEQIIEFMLETSARIGEVLAIRKGDVDVTRSPATVRISGTIVSPSGKPTHRQPHPKTQQSTRTVSVPSFTGAVLRDRLVRMASDEPEHLVFFSRNGTPLTTNNIRRRLRAVLEEAGIEGVTPHSFRRTVATVIDRAGGAELAAELLGHTSSRITREPYIQPDEAVDPVTAEILESLVAKRTGEPS
jgi:integrase